MTDGTPAACRQKNAAEYLAGRSPGVMTQYGGGLFGAEQHLHSREPAPDEDKSGVLQLESGAKKRLTVERDVKFRNYFPITC